MDYDNPFDESSDGNDFGDVNDDFKPNAKKGSNQPKTNLLHNSDDEDSDSDHLSPQSTGHNNHDRNPSHDSDKDSRLSKPDIKKPVTKPKQRQVGKISTVSGRNSHQMKQGQLSPTKTLQETLMDNMQVVETETDPFTLRQKNNKLQATLKSVKEQHNKISTLTHQIPQLKEKTEQTGKSNEDLEVKIKLTENLIREAQRTVERAQRRDENEGNLIHRLELDVKVLKVKLAKKDEEFRVKESQIVNSLERNEQLQEKHNENKTKIDKLINTIKDLAPDDWEEILDGIIKTETRKDAKKPSSTESKGKRNDPIAALKKELQTTINNMDRQIRVAHQELTTLTNELKGRQMDEKKREQQYNDKSNEARMMFLQLTGIQPNLAQNYAAKYQNPAGQSSSRRGSRPDSNSSQPPDNRALYSVSAPPLSPPSIRSVRKVPGGNARLQPLHEEKKPVIRKEGSRKEKKRVEAKSEPEWKDDDSDGPAKDDAGHDSDSDDNPFHVEDDTPKDAQQDLKESSPVIQQEPEEHANDEYEMDWDEDDDADAGPTKSPSPPPQDPSPPPKDESAPTTPPTAKDDFDDFEDFGEAPVQPAKAKPSQADASPKKAVSSYDDFDDFDDPPPKEEKHKPAKRAAPPPKPAASSFDDSDDSDSDQPFRVQKSSEPKPSPPKAKPAPPADDFDFGDEPPKPARKKPVGRPGRKAAAKARPDIDYNFDDF
ncbi:hypothetical protein BLNAU_3679 [Blattamonas nauphoetae]|uniref:Uncharacterized protein n=1 Tax=Blattamonas nauphoetae TaxID=2049346 RepID=A0ABQ9YBT9_9EUKA|nr:hypothetical protein BLNAU_3679 [Blattamonas nauphoetae]